MSELRAGPVLDSQLYEALTNRAVVECNKWNLKAGDLPTTCRFPLVVSRRLWASLTALAESLAREALDAERELLERPELQVLLGLSPVMADCLRAAAWSDAPRYTRFDFHPTVDGFRITESNCDVAGGLLEASGVGSIYRSLTGATLTGDPAGALVEAFAARFGSGARVGLLHLSEYVDDRQVVLYLAQRFEQAGLRPVLCHPAQLLPGLRVKTNDGPRQLDALYRFVPGTWLEAQSPRTAWRALFTSERVSNPLTGLFTQSKRFPLVWPQLRTPVPTWQRLMTATESPTVQHTLRDEWVLKPAFGFEGCDVVVSRPDDMRWCRAWESPTRWAVQRRFESTPLPTPDGFRHVCLGVFVVDGRQAGGYARLSEAPLIDDAAQEAVVLEEEEAQ